MNRKQALMNRNELERRLEVDAERGRAALSDDFTRSTMAKVRTANAIAQQRTALLPQPNRFMPAIAALAALVIVASLIALFVLPQSAAPPTQPTPMLVKDEPKPVATRINLPTTERTIERTAEVSSVFVKPFKGEADAILDAGRDLGMAMLATLPVQPRAWADRLETGAGR